MNCREMVQIPELENVLCLKAGAGGLENEVRWIYFADCLQCVQREYKMENYIHGGELVILTNRKVTDDPVRLLDLIEQMRVRRISALGINEGQISEQLVIYCEENDLPLFELPEKYPLIDLSQNICKRLVLEENCRNSAEQLFSSILDAEHLSRENVMAQAGYLNINLEGSFCVAEFTFDRKDELNSGNGFKKKECIAEELFEKGQKLRKMIQAEFCSSMGENLLILTQTGSVLVLIPARGEIKNLIKKIATRIIEKLQKKYQESCYVGVGDSKEYLTEIRDSRNEAATAIWLAMASGKNRKTNDRILFFSELGVYTLISHVSDQKILDNYVESHLGKLMQADKLHKGNLCETLEHYLSCNCNAKKTAEEMFVHRNTLNYRLKKISEIQECDFEELEECLELKLAFEILKYCAPSTKKMFHDIH